MYAMGDFEHALVSYHRAAAVPNLLMKERRELEDGIQQSEEAIKKILEKNKNPFHSISQCTKALGNLFLNLPLYELKSFLLTNKDESKHNSNRNRQNDFIEDMEYIEHFIEKMDELGIGGDQKVSREANLALNYLSDRREFWSQNSAEKL